MPDGHYVAGSRRPIAELGPRVLDLAALIESITAMVGELSLIASGMGFS